MNNDDDRVHANLVGTRNVGEAERRQRAEAPEPERQAEPSADERQHRRLGDELADDASPGGAKRVTRGDLLQSSARAREREIRDVHRGDEEQARDAAPEHLERRAHVCARGRR